jgi:CRISPR-associated protein Csb2
MLALTVDLPTGRFYACAYNDRTAPEWPPHPARLFSALVAALPAGDEPPDPDAEGALRWLEALPPPAITASQASSRRVLDVYVPVNDVAVVNDSRVESAQARLAEAEAEAEASDMSGPKERARAEKSIEKAKVALHTAAAAAIAALPAEATPSKEDLALVRRRFDENGLRQRRFFPSVTPEVPSVTYQWPEAAPSSVIEQALARLVARVGRLGHSASLVAVRLDAAPPPPTLVPAPGGAEILRAVGPGQLDALRAAWLLHRETDPRVLPARFVAYGAPQAVGGPAAPARGAFAPPERWLLFRRAGGARLPISAAVQVARQVRRVLLAHGGTPSPEVLSGHTADGAPSPRPHLAVVPLPFVDHPHADGSLLGVALVFPADCPPAARQVVLAAVARWEAAAPPSDEDEALPALPVPLGAAGVLALQRVLGPPPIATLDGARWCRPARVWATVTPIALDRNPGNLDARDPSKAHAAAAEAARLIGDAVVRQGLPAPVRVEVHPAPGVLGSRPVRDFPPFPAEPGKTRRVRVHAHLVFDTPICGPLILGAGRFAGLGLCRPLPESDR